MQESKSPRLRGRGLRERRATCGVSGPRFRRRPIGVREAKDGGGEALEAPYAVEIGRGRPEEDVDARLSVLVSHTE